MIKEIKEKWLAALRSGEYKQGRKVLRNIENNTFCCLGVLCDLHSKETGEKWIAGGDFRFEGSYSYLGTHTCLPDGVMIWAGFTDFCNCNPNLGAESASQCNDNGQDFNTIADKIKKYL